jgi:hypothetical protein
MFALLLAFDDDGVVDALVVSFFEAALLLTSPPFFKSTLFPSLPSSTLNRPPFEVLGVPEMLSSPLFLEFLFES